MDKIAEIEEWVDKVNAAFVKGQELLEKLQAQLAQAEKPELRHGDYGWDAHFNQHAPADPRVYLDGHHYGCNGGNQDKFPLVFVVGNIFADLAALSEPLTEFDLCTCRFELFNQGKQVRLFHAGVYAHFGNDNLAELILNLQRLLHTAQRKDNGIDD